MRSRSSGEAELHRQGISRAWCEERKRARVQALHLHKRLVIQHLFFGYWLWALPGPSWGRDESDSGIALRNSVYGWADSGKDRPNPEQMSFNGAAQDITDDKRSPLYHSMGGRPRRLP